MDIDLRNKRFCILGLQGSGKSVLVKDILNDELYHLVYDVHHEHQGFKRYLVEHKRPDWRKKNDPSIIELNLAVDRLIHQSGKIRRFVLEEANRYCPNKRPLPSSILVLNDDQRHDRVAFGSVARRASQLNSDLVELAHYLFIFHLVGKNDYQRLESEAEGLGDAVRGLEEFCFVVVNPDRSYYVHKPVEYKRG